MVYKSWENTLKSSRRNEQLLVVLSTSTPRSLKFLSEILNTHRRENVWLIVDRSTMRVLASMGLLRELPVEKVIVYAGRNPEETALRVFTLVKPSRVYVCDEKSSLDPVTRFLTVVGVELYTC
jgi:hypothetical protein